MKLFLAASTNPFDLKAALLAGHAQHPVIIHFPIALLIASVVFELLAVWRKQPVFASVAYDLRAYFRFAHLRSLLDALAPPRERFFAGYRLFRSDFVRADDDHAHRPSRWNP